MHIHYATLAASRCSNTSEYSWEASGQPRRSGPSCSAFMRPVGRTLTSSLAAAPQPVQRGSRILRASLCSKCLQGTPGADPDGAVPQYHPRSFHVAEIAHSLQAIVPQVGADHTDGMQRWLRNHCPDRLVVQPAAHCSEQGVWSLGQLHADGRFPEDCVRLVLKWGAEGSNNHVGK